MLDLDQRYFVVASSHTLKEMKNWASMYTMKIKKEVSLPTCGRAYELDVRQNEGLFISMQAGYAELLNDEEEAFGRVSYDLVGMDTCVVVHPYFVKGEGM